MFFFPRKTWCMCQNTGMRRCFGVVDPKRAAQRCVCEIGARPKGVIFERSSCLHCSNLLAECYVTGHLHTETHSPDPHHAALWKKISTQFMPRGSLGEELREDGDQMGRGNKTEMVKPVRGEKRHKSSVIVWLWLLKADQIICCYVEITWLVNNAWQRATLHPDAIINPLRITFKTL